MQVNESPLFCTFHVHHAFIVTTYRCRWTEMRCQVKIKSSRMTSSSVCTTVTSVLGTLYVKDSLDYVQNQKHKTKL